MFKKSVVMLLISALIAACAGTGIKPEERDRTGKYDGNWLLSWQIKKHTTVIEGSGTFWQLRCPEYSHRLPVEIRDGTISPKLPGNKEDYVKEYGAFVKEDGTLYVNWSIPNTKTSHDIEDRRLIFSGSLDESRGEGTLISTFDSPTQGCKGKFTMEKSD